jgi:hypothetical protein
MTKAPYQIKLERKIKKFILGIEPKHTGLVSETIEYNLVRMKRKKVK